MTKFDFSTNENKASRFSNDKYSKAKAGVGTMFFSGKSRPSSVQVVRAYLSANNWISSVQEFEDSAEIRFTNSSSNCDTFRITIEDARKLLEALPSIISDAEQIKEALVKVLPVKDAEDFDDDNDDDDDDND